MFCLQRRFVFYFKRKIFYVEQAAAMIIDEIEDNKKTLLKIVFGAWIVPHNGARTRGEYKRPNELLKKYQIPETWQIHMKDPLLSKLGRMIKTMQVQM